MTPVQTFTFAEQLLLNIAGPLLTALLVGIGFADVLRRAQARHDTDLRALDELRAQQALEIEHKRQEKALQIEHKRQDQALQIERHREDHELRDRLISQAIEAPSALYLATQHYWRAKDDALSADELRQFRDALDAQYLESRRQGLVLEHRLRLYFAGQRPCQLSHRLMDLLTIRYFQLVRKGGASEELRKMNEGEEHTGLSAAELMSGPKILAKYHATINELVNAVADGTLVERAGPESQRGPPE